MRKVRFADPLDERIDDPLLLRQTEAFFFNGASEEQVDLLGVCVVRR